MVAHPKIESEDVMSEKKDGPEVVVRETVAGEGADVQAILDDVVMRSMKEKTAARREIEQLEMHVKELEKQLLDERHEFKRKQLGMSTLATVLMDARFGEGGNVYIGRDEFIRLASEAEATRADNEMLREKLEKVREDLRLAVSGNITHRMALEESTGLKLAEVIIQRDNLMKELLATKDPRIVDEIMFKGCPSKDVVLPKNMPVREAVKDDLVDVDPRT